MELRDIGKATFGQQFKENLKQAWYFDKYYEKAILVIMGFLSMWKIVDLVKSLF
jgi:hypothetical protein|tara:strand:+ start:5069 stop:5230 length:162 start_codon:yes stop_codon:yes gene_type:complete